ncbi:MAG: hypothetical protein Q9174_004015 [Haloplaca sp. 1 TL-2023]
MELQALVDLSFQAVHRQLSESSKSLIKERGLDASVSARIRRTSGRYYERDDRPVSGGHHRHSRRRDYSPSMSSADSLDYDVTIADDMGRVRSTSYERSRPKLMPALPSTRANAGKVETENKQPQETRFTLPSAQPAKTKKAPDSKAQPTQTTLETPEDKTSKELNAARVKLEQLKEKQKEAEKSRDIATASDLLYYAIPDQTMKIDHLLKAQKESQDRKKAQQPEVHSGSEEDDDDEEKNEDMDLYD